MGGSTGGAMMQKRDDEAGEFIRRPAVTERLASASQEVNIVWHRDWDEAVTKAFAVMPYDPLMDPTLVRRLWDDGMGRDRQKIAVIRSEDWRPVGVVLLRKRGKLSWQLLTQYVMPYARFFVRPEHTDAALRALGRYVDCDNVLFYQTPSHTRMLRPEESWVVPLACSYEELMQRTKYRKEDRQCRRYSENLELREDNYDAMPLALEHWQAKWETAGSHATARRADDLLLGFETLAEQGRLKTFSLHDGGELAAMEMNMIGPNTLYSISTITRQEYRSAHPGIRLTLAAMEWACGEGLAEYDMLRTSGHYKKAWAAPEVRGYRVVRSPFGIQALGIAVEGAKEWLRKINT